MTTPPNPSPATRSRDDMLRDLQYLSEQVDALRGMLGRIEIEQPPRALALESVRFTADSLAQGLRDLAHHLETFAA